MTTTSYTLCLANIVVLLAKARDFLVFACMSDVTKCVFVIGLVHTNFRYTHILLIYNLLIKSKKS
jgi:hypothetical protein